MHFQTSILFAGIGLATTVVAAGNYQLRVTGSENPIINNQFIARQSDTKPASLGIWATDRMYREPVQLTVQQTSDTRFFELITPQGNEQIMLSGLAEAMDLIITGKVLGANHTGQNVSHETGKNATYWDQFVLYPLSGSRVALRHGQDAQMDVPVGGAGSWRACKGNSVNDYPLYWYDGSSPLPYQNCEGITLEIVQVNGASSTSTNATATRGTASPTGSLPSSATDFPFEGSATSFSPKYTLFGMAAAALLLAI